MTADPLVEAKKDFLEKSDFLTAATELSSPRTPRSTQSLAPATGRANTLDGATANLPALSDNDLKDAQWELNTAIKDGITLQARLRNAAGNRRRVGEFAAIADAADRSAQATEFGDVLKSVKDLTDTFVTIERNAAARIEQVKQSSPSSSTPSTTETTSRPWEICCVPPRTACKWPRILVARRSKRR